MEPEQEDFYVFPNTIDTSWYDRARCRNFALKTDDGGEYFFPDCKQQQKQARLARTFCHGCEVRTDCLMTALEANEIIDGIWGGATPRERRQLKKVSHRPLMFRAMLDTIRIRLDTIAASEVRKGYEPPV